MPVKITRPDGTVIEIEPEFFMVEATTDRPIRPEEVDEIENLKPHDIKTSVIVLTGVKVVPVYADIPLLRWS